MESRPKQPKYARNKNIVVIGGSGSGKTRFFVKPSVMQMNCSMVITDPKGTLIEECGKMLAKGPPKKDKNGNIMKDKSGKVVHEPYVIKVLNTINFSKSLHYNPFAYIRSEKDILKLVTTIIVNTKGEGEKASEDFWVKAEKLLYTALIAFIWYEGDEEEKNLNTLLDLLNESETREEDETYQNPVDMMFQELEERDPQHFAVRQYKKYKMAAGKTAKSILISCGARLAPFDIAELREIMSYDEMELDKIGDRKTALFLIMSDTDTTFNFVIAMLQSQLFNLLCDKADDEYGGRLPVHVRVIADEFANIGQIPQFDKLIATIRSREISASIILQSQSQLREAVDGRYGKDANRVLRAIDSAEKDCGIRLLEADPKAEGVIGSRVLPKGWVARKPSDIYWNGIRTFGIFCDYGLSIPEYVSLAVKLKEQKSVSRLGNRNDDAEENDKDDSDAGDIGNIRFWNLPIYHDDWRDNLTIELTQMMEMLFTKDWRLNNAGAYFCKDGAGEKHFS